MDRHEIIEYFFKALMAILTSICLFLFNSFDQSLKDFDNSLDKMQSSVNKLNISFAKMSERLIAVNYLNNKMEKEVERMKQRLNDLERGK